MKLVLIVSLAAVSSPVIVSTESFAQLVPIVVTASALIVASPVQSDPVHSALREFQYSSTIAVSSSLVVFSVIPELFRAGIAISCSAGKLQNMSNIFEVKTIDEKSCLMFIF